MKKWIIGALCVAAATGYGIHYVETEYAGIGLPWTTEVDLPPLPPVENVKTSLSENDQGTIRFPSKSPYDFSVLLTDYANAPDSVAQGDLFLPPNPSVSDPVPAMVILHGSGGLRDDREYEYARIFNAMGIAALVLDYYTPRGVTPDFTYIQKTLTTSETDIVVDAYAALRILGTHPLIDARKIGVTGYSYGGMATRYTLDTRIKALLAPDIPGFAAHADFYGPCHQTLGHNEFVPAAYLAVFGDSDNSVNPAQCEPVHQAIKDSGMPTEIIMMPGAGHAWENKIERKDYDYPFINNCAMSFTPDTGLPLINGKLVTHAEQGASRERRAYLRARIMMDAPECVGRGYLIGRDENANTIATQALKRFLTTHLLN